VIGWRVATHGETSASRGDPGDRLPSVRQLARELAVNQNTILHVYERLTHEGLLQRRHGDGTFVADTLPRGHDKAQQQSLAHDLDRVAGRMLDLGIESDDAHDMLDRSLARMRKTKSHQLGVNNA
jgi:GntR family transcriptional regulator